MTGKRRRLWAYRTSSSRHFFRSLVGMEPLEDRALLAIFNPLPGAADGAAGSLRAAILAANTNAQNDTINLQAGTYTLSLANVADQENLGALGDLGDSQRQPATTSSRSIVLFPLPRCWMAGPATTSCWAGAATTR